MPPSRDREAVRRRERILARVSTACLYLVGAYLIVAPIAVPNLSGWSSAVESVGEVAILRVAVGFLFLYFATLTREKYKLKFIVEDVLEALNTFLYGKDYRRHREAVEILLRSLATPDSRVRERAVEALQKITGQRFGDDAAAWRKWWEINQRTFRARVADAASPEESPRA
jgi:hypothetical protein